MKFNQTAVQGNLQRQLLGEKPERMMWLCQAWMPENALFKKSGPCAWRPAFSCENLALLKAVSDMRRFNRNLKLRVLALVLVEDDKKGEFHEF